MSEAVIAAIAAIIVGIISLIGVIITTIAGNKKVMTELTNKLEVSQAVTDTKLTGLTEEVRSQNIYTQRVPVIEERLNGHEKRIESLERGRTA